MSTASLIVGLSFVVPLLATFFACMRSQRNRVVKADAVLESQGWSMVGMVVCSVLLLLLFIVATILHAPKGLFEHLLLLSMLLLLAIGVCATCNKRLAVIGQRLIDVSMTGRRREFALSGPVQFDNVLFGWRLRLTDTAGARSVFIPGSWLMGDTDAIRQQLDDFKEFVMTRAEPPSSR